MQHHLTLPIKALAKQSYRSTKTGFGYQTKEVKAYQKAIKMLVCSMIPAKDRPLQGEIAISVEFVFKHPKSWSNARVDELKTRFVHKPTKPDIDNLLKGLFDALNGCLWIDDAQVVSVIASKRWGRSDMVGIICRNYITDEYAFTAHRSPEFVLDKKSGHI